MKKITFLMALAILISSCSVADRAEENIIPTPVSVERLSGNFILKSDTPVAVSDESLLPAAGYLTEILGIDSVPEVKAGKIKKGISLSLVAMENPGSYRLSSDINRILVEAPDYEGIISAIATLRQLVPSGERCRIPAVRIEDSPQFAWRGFMMDASRHFFTKEEVKDVLDLMASYKLNRFHWHLTDDQGWRIEIKKYPELTSAGAWRRLNNHDRTCLKRAAEEDNADLLLPDDRLVTGTAASDTLYGGFYTQEDIREIVAYAGVRGIEVIPEIDMPGHFLAAIGQYPELACDGQIGWGETFSSPLCIGKDAVLDFCRDVYTEVFGLFPSEFVHMGGDEVEKTNWKRCPKCQKRIRDEKLGSVEQLQAWFVREMEKFFTANGRRLIGWDEVIGDGLDRDAVIMWWRSWVTDAVPRAASQGKNIIVCPSELLYFSREADLKSIGNLLAYDPCAGLSEDEKGLVLGVQANIWAEQVPSARRLQYMLVPRIFALSEIAWTSPEKIPATEDFERIMIPHFRRMDASSINYRVPDLLGLYDVNVIGDGAEVSLGCPLPGVTVRYTLDGSIPDNDSPVYDGHLVIKEPASLVFRTFRPDGTPAGVTRAEFVEDAFTEPAERPEGLEPGLEALWYEHKVFNCTDVDKAPLKGTYIVDSVCIPEAVKGRIALILRGYMDIPEDGVYTFALYSDDGSTFTVDGVLAGDNDGEHSPKEITFQKSMKAGLHPVEVRYFDSNGGVLQMQLIEKDGSRRNVPSSWFLH